MFNTILSTSEKHPSIFYIGDKLILNMGFIKGNDRDKVTFFTFESQIVENNPVRFVDAFVENLDLTQLGFLIYTIKTESRPAFYFFNYKLTTYY